MHPTYHFAQFLQCDHCTHFSKRILRGDPEALQFPSLVVDLSRSRKNSGERQEAKPTDVSLLR